MELHVQKYMPCVKTSVSEFRAISNLEKNVLDAMLPLFELTRGRRTKSDREGEVDKNIKKISEDFENRPFLLDLTRDQSNRNLEIESFLQRDNGFHNWVHFIRKVQLQCPLVIPVLQSSSTSTVQDIKNQVQRLSEICNCIAIRVVPSNYIKFKEAGFKQLLLEALSVIPSNTKLIFVADSENIRKTNGKCDLVFFSKAATECIADMLALATQVGYSNYSIFHISSSFPQSINVESEGDAKGEAELFELSLQQLIEKELGNERKVGYGDYACIYQFQKPIVAYNWVPRVDYPISSGKCIYYRYRSVDGGYLKCVTSLVQDARFRQGKVSCWGTDQVTLSFKNQKQTGGSPSFWISVRANVWMTKMATQ